MAPLELGRGHPNPNYVGKEEGQGGYAQEKSGCSYQKGKQMLDRETIAHPTVPGASSFWLREMTVQVLPQAISCGIALGVFTP